MLANTLLSLIALSISSVEALYGCQLETDYLTSGLNYNYYAYPVAVTETDPSYFESDYTTQILIGSGGGVMENSFSLTADNTLFGVIPQSYILQFTGYFIPQISGIYSVVIDQIADNALFFMGEGAFNCGDESDLNSDSSSYLLFGSTPDDTSVQTYVSLQAGVYYPLRIVTAANGSFGSLNYYFVDPKGNSITDLTGYVFSGQNLVAKVESVESNDTIYGLTAGLSASYITTTNYAGKTVRVATNYDVVVPTATTSVYGETSTTYIQTFELDTATLVQVAVADPALGDGAILSRFVSVSGLPTVATTTATTQTTTAQSGAQNIFPFTNTVNADEGTSPIVNASTVATSAEEEATQALSSLAITTTTTSEAAPSVIATTTTSETEATTDANVSTVETSASQAETTAFVSASIISTTSSAKVSNVDTTEATSDATTDGATTASGKALTVPTDDTSKSNIATSDILATSADETTASSSVESTAATSSEAETKTSSLGLQLSYTPIVSGIPTTGASSVGDAQSVLPSTSATVVASVASSPIPTSATTSTIPDNIPPSNVYVWTALSSSTISLFYYNNALSVPSGGLFKRDTITSVDVAVLIPTPSVVGWNEPTTGTTTVTMTELLNDGTFKTITVEILETPNFTAALSSSVPRSSATGASVSGSVISSSASTVTKPNSLVNASGSLNATTSGTTDSAVNVANAATNGATDGATDGVTNGFTNDATTAASDVATSDVTSGVYVGTSSVTSYGQNQYIDHTSTVFTSNGVVYTAPLDVVHVRCVSKCIVTSIVQTQAVTTIAPFTYTTHVPGKTIHVTETTHLSVCASLAVDNDVFVTRWSTSTEVVPCDVTSTIAAHDETTVSMGQVVYTTQTTIATTTRIAPVESSSESAQSSSETVASASTEPEFNGANHLAGSVVAPLAVLAALLL